MKALSRHMNRLLAAHIRADRNKWPPIKRTLTHIRQRRAADRLFLRKMAVEERLKQGCRIWWPKGENGHPHLFGRSPVALAEGSLTPPPNPRPRAEIPFGRDRFFLDAIPF